MANDPAILDSRGTISADQLADLGWELKAQGLCQDDTCVLVPDPAALQTDDGLDLELLGSLIDRPVVFDAEAGVAAIGAPRADRRRVIDDLDAPDFSLPGIDGELTALSDHRSKKRLLVAFSSW